MTEILIWCAIAAVFVLWARWPHIQARRLHRRIRRAREIKDARERSMAIHPSNRD